MHPSTANNSSCTLHRKPDILDFNRVWSRHVKRKSKEVTRSEIVGVNPSLRRKWQFNFLGRFSVCDSLWIQQIEPSISDPVTSFRNLFFIFYMSWPHPVEIQNITTLCPLYPVSKIAKLELYIPSLKPYILGSEAFYTNRSFVKPSPITPNPTPRTLNPDPCSLMSNLVTINREPSTRNH